MRYFAGGMVLGLVFCATSCLTRIALAPAAPPTVAEILRGGDLVVANGAPHPGWTAQRWLVASGGDGSPCARCGRCFGRWDTSSVTIYDPTNAVAFHGCRTCLLAALRAVPALTWDTDRQLVDLRTTATITTSCPGTMAAIVSVLGAR